MSDQPLNPCPFCGSTTAPVLLVYSRANHVYCGSLRGGCGARGPYKSTPQEAIEAWNKCGGPGHADCEKPLQGKAMTKRSALEIASRLETFGPGWIDAVDMHQAEIERMTAERLNIERETIISDFLKRTGQYVTNDASREAATAAAVLAEREAISAKLRELADELGHGLSWWGTPSGLLYRAAEMVSDRTKP